MLGYQCYVCGRMWTKLKDGGCIGCDAPCEIISVTEYPVMPTNTSRSPRNRQPNLIQTGPLYVTSDTPALNQEPRALQVVDSNESSISLDEIRSRQKNVAEASRSPEKTSRFSTGLQGFTGTRQGRQDWTTNSDNPTAVSEEGDEDSRSSLDLQSTTRTNTRRPSSARSSLVSPRKNDKVQALSSAKENSQAKKKEKKLKKKDLKDITDALKLAAQLPQPDPIPAPGTMKPEAAWNEVVSKKRNNFVSHIAEGRHKKNVNASSHLARSDEFEGLGLGLGLRDRAAVNARVDLRGAKHAIKANIPRSALE